MRTLDVGQKQAAYTGVIVHAGQTEDGQSIDYSVGNDTGSVLEVTVPNGTLALAYMLLDKLKLRGYRYQPFEADGAIADPSIEIGDNITANDVPSIVMGINTNHSRLMASTLKAPFDEEVNHEWKYEPRSERQFKRESAYTRSRLTITEGQISAEVIRASDAENILSGRIDVNADHIEAKVSKSGGSSQSFGWNLTDSSWTLNSNGSEVFKATSSGIEVKGKITATSGYIGSESAGFEIGSTHIRNGMTSRDDTSNNGVYIGTDGIALGQGKFKATSAGVVTATSGVIGGFNFTGTGLVKSTPDVSTEGASQYRVMLQAPETASASNAAIAVSHRTYSNGSYGAWTNDFVLTYGGNLTANTGTFKGDVYAGNIKHGVVGGIDYGTLSGSGLSDYSIGGTKYGLSSIANGNMVDSTLTTGKMVSGIGTSLGYANFSNSVFNNTDVAPYVTAQIFMIQQGQARYSMSMHTHYFQERNGFIYMSSNGGEDNTVDWTGGEQGFNIADTQTYKDAVASARSAGYDEGYSAGWTDGIQSLNRITTIYVTSVFSDDTVGLRAYHSQGDYSYARLSTGDYWNGYDD